MKRSFGTRHALRKYLLVIDCAEGYEGEAREFRCELACPTIVWITAVVELVASDINEPFTDAEVFEHVYGTCNMLTSNAWDDRVDQAMCQRVFGHAARRIRAEVLNLVAQTNNTTLGAVANYHNGRLEVEIYVK